MANTYITIAGTSYRYKKTEPSSGETWVLNETLTNQSYGIESITFSSNNTTYTKFARYYKTDMLGEVEQDYVAFYTSDTDSVTVYDRGTWSNAAYRTITFATTPTGDLLTWLQANGTKQGGGAVTGYNVTITTQNKLWDDPFCDMAIKFDSEPTSDTDYDFYVDMSGNITGNTSFTNKTTMWVWQTSGSSNRIGINGTTYTVNIWGTGGPNEFTLTENSAIIAYYHS